MLETAAGMAGGLATGLFLALLLATQLLHLLGLPANWLLLLLVSAYAYLSPLADFPAWFFVLLGGLAALGEVLEQVVGVLGAARYGSSGRGMLGAFIGGFAGGILGAPVLFGLGALPGALLGAYGGGLAFELLHDRPFAEAHRSAMGNLLGRVLGMILKLALGLVMFAATFQRLALQ